MSGGYNSGSPGGFTRVEYDNCAYNQKLYESTEPLVWRMYSGKFENCEKCVYDKNNFWRPFDNEIVDTESELKNITRKNTRCNRQKYNPNCKKSGTCTSTFDKSVPIVFPQEVCPIVKNNIQKMTGPGYSLYSAPLCDAYKKNVDYQRKRSSELDYRV
jgi:hypothetical protein